MYCVLVFTELTCFSSGSILHCWCCTRGIIAKLPCCNPVLSTWYCRADCNSPPSTCIHILSYHWYSKTGHLISSNDSCCTAVCCCLIHHLWASHTCDSDAWRKSCVWERRGDGEDICDYCMYIYCISSDFSSRQGSEKQHHLEVIGPTSRTTWIHTYIQEYDEQLEVAEEIFISRNT